MGVAAQNCALLTRRLDYMDFARAQIDVLIARGFEQNDQLYVPHKYDDPGLVDYEPGVWMWHIVKKEDGTALQQDGWFEFMPMYPSDIAHLWCMSMTESDSERFQQTRRRSGDQFDVNSWHHTKDQGGHDWGWLAYLHGEFPEYPEQILAHNLAQVQGRLDFMAQDEQDPATYNDAYFQQRNPVTCEGLVQLTLGAPLPHYNGGLLVTRLRFFDAQRRRPGLPGSRSISCAVPGLTYEGSTDSESCVEAFLRLLAAFGIHEMEMQQHFFRTRCSWRHRWPRRTCRPRSSCRIARLHYRC